MAVGVACTSLTTVQKAGSSISAYACTSQQWTQDAHARRHKLQHTCQASYQLMLQFSGHCLNKPSERHHLPVSQYTCV